MSGRGWGKAPAAAAGPDMPAAARGLVKSLKDNVNVPNVDIYSMLDERDLDPDDAVSRLPYQDTFREVKNKHETRKENEGFSGMKSLGPNTTSNRGGMIMAYWSSGRSDAGHLRASSATSYCRKKMGGAFPPTSIDSIRGSYSIHAERNRLSAEESSLPSSSQSPYGKLSMADILKTERPQSKSFTSPFTSLEDHPNFLASQAIFPGLGGISNENVRSMEDCMDDSSNLSQEIFRSTIPAEIQVLDHGENNNSEPNLESHFNVDIFNNASHFEDNTYNDCPDYLQRSFEHQEVLYISRSRFSATTFTEEEVGLLESALNAEDNPAVVMPDHLQMSSVYCGHLKYGVFESRMNAVSFSGPFVEKFQENPYNVAADGARAASVESLDERKKEYDRLEHPSSSQLEVMKYGASIQSIQGRPYGFSGSSVEKSLDNSPYVAAFERLNKRMKEYSRHDQLSPLQHEVVKNGASLQSIQGHPYAFSGPFVDKSMENSPYVVAADAASIELLDERRNKCYGHNQHYSSQSLVLKHGASLQSIQEHPYDFSVPFVDISLDNKNYDAAVAVDVAAFERLNERMKEYSRHDQLASVQPEVMKHRASLQSIQGRPYAFSGPFVDKSLENSSYGVVADAAPVERLDERRGEYCGHDQPYSSQPSVMKHGASFQNIQANPYAFPGPFGNKFLENCPYDLAVDVDVAAFKRLSERMKEYSIHEHGIQGLQYGFKNTGATYAFENTAKANAAAGVFSIQTNSQIQSSARLSSMLDEGSNFQVRDSNSRTMFTFPPNTYYGL